MGKGSTNFACNLAALSTEQREGHQLNIRQSGREEVKHLLQADFGF